MKITCLIYVMLGLMVSSLHAQTIQLLDEKSGEPLAFRKVTFLPTREFIVTDIEGKFKLTPQIVTDNREVMVSGFGLDDVLFDLNEIKSSTGIKLKVKELELAEMLIKSSPLKAIQIGDSSRDLVQESKSRKLVSEDMKTLNNLFYGVKIALPKSNEIFLSKVKFHVGEPFHTHSALVNLRLFGVAKNKNLVDYKIYNPNEFTELGFEPILESVKDGGWKEIVLSEPLKISREYKYLVIILELYEESDLFSISYHQHKDNKIKSAMYAPPNTVYFFPVNGSSYHAFEVELLLD